MLSGNVGRFYILLAETAEVAVAQIIGYNEDDVWPFCRIFICGKFTSTAG
jgi:hypothetical protein